MSGQVDASDAPARIAGCVDKIKEVMVACSRNQEQQRNHIAELQKASNVQEQKLASLHQQMIELKARMKARIKAAPVKVLAPKESEVYDSASGTSSLKVTPPRDPAMSQATAIEKVYSNGKVSFTREQLLRSLDLPPDTIDFRMEPFLQELAKELGRPGRKPAPAPVRYPQRSGNRHHSCNYNSTSKSSHNGGKWDNWKNHGQEACDSNWVETDSKRSGWKSSDTWSKRWTNDSSSSWEW